LECGTSACHPLLVGAGYVGLLQIARDDVNDLLGSNRGRHVVDEVNQDDQAGHGERNEA
jgi:hypothetical protein